MDIARLNTLYVAFVAGNGGVAPTAILLSAGDLRAFRQTAGRETTNYVCPPPGGGPDQIFRAGDGSFAFNGVPVDVGAPDGAPVFLTSAPTAAELQAADEVEPSDPGAP